MNTMTYRGYTARIDYDNEDGIFFGRVLGIKAIVGFHGSTVDELRQDFKNAIDFLIDDAQARGVEPEQPADEELVLHLPPEVRGAALTAAHAKGQSLDQWSARVLMEAAEG
jgi:predicted HicB family RNase H-like nuclease